MFLILSISIWSRLSLTLQFHTLPSLGHLRCSCCLRHGPYVQETDGDLFLGGYYGAYRPLGFPPALAEERHYGPSSNTSGLSCIVDAFGLLHVFLSTGQGC